MSNVDKNRIEILKRNARRKGLINEISHLVTVSKESFIDAESNDLFCKKLYSKLEQILDKKIFGDTDYKKIDSYH